MLLVKPGQKHSSEKMLLLLTAAPLTPNRLLPAGLLLLFARQKTVQGTVCPVLMLKKNKGQKMGQSWLIVVRLPVHKFNCIQLLIVLPSAQKQTGRERYGFAFVLIFCDSSDDNRSRIKILLFMQCKKIIVKVKPEQKLIANKKMRICRSASITQNRLL
jgi:hypothetical protein